VELGFASDDVEAAAQQLVDDPAAAGVARWDAGFSVVGGGALRAFGLAPLRGEMGFALRSGRQPVPSDEVVVGPTTLERLGLSLGDAVEVAAASGDPPATVHVVGTALFPEIDEGNLTDAVGYFDDGFAAHASAPDRFEASQVAVRFAPGADRAALLDAVSERHPTDVSSAEIDPEPPRSVGNLFELRQLPRWLAAFVAVLGLASLAHIVFTTLHRRQAEFATLRSLGFTGRQAGRCVVWQTVTIGIVGLLIGVPIGLLAGRTAWWATADPIGVATDVRVPWFALSGWCIGALAAGAVLGWAFSRRPTHRPIADALRVE
jgi:predicted lysophospholipase L1 biosynthesis ABC-type transport system permease subunit